MSRDRKETAAQKGNRTRDAAMARLFAKGRFDQAASGLGRPCAYSFSDVIVILRDAAGVIVPKDSTAGLSDAEQRKIADALRVETGGAWTFDLPAEVVDDRIGDGQVLELNTQVLLSDTSGTESGLIGTQAFQLHLTDPVTPPTVIHSEICAALAEPVALMAMGRLPVQDLDIGDPMYVEVRPQSADYVGTLSVPAADVAPMAWPFGATASLTWDFAVTETEADDLSVGEEREQIYDLVFSDRKGRQIVQTVMINVIGTNDVPLVRACGTTVLN